MSAPSSLPGNGTGLGNAGRAGLKQAAIELRTSLLSWMILGYLLIPVIALIVLNFLDGIEVMGSDVSLAQIGIPGLLGMGLVVGGVLGVAGELCADREDGTLLRAKAIPHGMLGHLVGKVIVHTVSALISIALLLVPAAFLFNDVTPNRSGGWFTLLWVGVLGMFATLPIGAVLGSLFSSMTGMMSLSLVVYGMTAFSGIFYPLSALPGWLQGLGQILPMYWLGLGMRAALLPPEAAALEIGGTWRMPEMVAVLGLWAALGLLLAPVVLRRMARRQSGSQVAAARDRVMSKGY